LKRENPERKNTEISKLLGELWKKSPAHIRQPHIEREQRERESYKCRIAEWREKRQREEDHAKQQRIAVAEQYVQSGGMSLPTTSTTTQGVPVPTDLLSWGAQHAALPSAMVPIQPYYSIQHTPMMFQSNGEHPAVLAPFPPLPPQETPTTQYSNDATARPREEPPMVNYRPPSVAAPYTSTTYYAPAVSVAPEVYQQLSHDFSLQEKSFPTMSIGKYNIML
jgi:hypothetical protein